MLSCRPTEQASYSIAYALLDGAVKNLEDPLPPLIDGIVFLDELLVADGPSPLQDKGNNDYPDSI